MDISIVASVVISGVGLYISYNHNQRTKEISVDQMQKQLFTEFNSRYNELNDSLVRIETEAKELEEFKVHENYKELRQKVIDYFSLFAEEYYWYKHKGRIDETVWNSWNEGMNYWYNNVPCIKEIWLQEVQNNCKSYYIKDGNEFFKESKQ